MEWVSQRIESRVRAAFALFMGIILVPSALAAGGVRVSRVMPTQSSSVAPEQVSVRVFFDFSPTSRALLDGLKNWAVNAGSAVLVGREPVVTVHDRMLVRAFFVARILGVMRPVLPGLFSLALSSGGNEPDRQALARVFKPWGIAPVEFQAAWNSPRAAKAMIRAQALGERFRVKRAPVIVVNGIWRIDIDPQVEPPVVLLFLTRQVNLVRQEEARNE